MVNIIVMEENQVRKLRLLSNQQIALSDIWEDEFCFPNTVEIEFGPQDEDGNATLKGINLYLDSEGSYHHIVKHLGFEVYHFPGMHVSGHGSCFKLPDYPITIICEKMQVPSPICAILSGYPPGYGQ
jgi:hypothetical protein